MSIKVITEPSIYLLARQSIEQDELDRFLVDNESPGWSTDAHGDPEGLVEVAGRLCYQSFAKPRPGGNAAYIGHILEVGHGSVIEHAVFTFLITGVSRSLTHELVRHRAGMSYSQLSQRFVDESEVAFVVPPALASHVAVFLELERQVILSNVLSGEEARGRDWVDSVRKAQVSYCRLSDDLMFEFAHVEDKTARRKMAREAARSVLPNCTETKIVVTANARAIRNFLEQRGAPGADAEIRRLAIALFLVVKAESPSLFADFGVVEMDGVKHLTNTHRKV